MCTAVQFVHLVTSWLIIHTLPWRSKTWPILPNKSTLYYHCIRHILMSPIKWALALYKVFITQTFSRVWQIMYNISVDEWYGFRRRLSTTNATRWLTEIILNIWNNNRYTGGVYCDLTKVFCCANYELSLKLQYYAVKGLDSLKSCLHSRTQRVELKFSSTCNHSSTWKTVKCCVPKGSVLGPLLFSVYNDDETCSIDNSTNEIMYSDDRSILTANNCYE